MNLQTKPGDLLIFIHGGPDAWWVHVIEPRRDVWYLAERSPHADRIQAFREALDRYVARETGLYVLTEAGELWRAAQYALSAGQS